jgi:GT2 family glycosyltransferase
MHSWVPSLPVSVVIPAFGGQQELDLTLAALSVQTYPAGLTEVIVVDDGSRPRLRLPEIRPENTAIMRSPANGRGAGHAMNAGIDAAGGEIVHRLDADMVICREHLEALMRWQHLTDYIVTIGGKKFYPDPVLLSPEQVRDAVREGDLATLFDPSVLVSSATEETIRRLNGLRTSKNPYQVCTGPTVSLRRTLLKEVRGFDAELIRGQDTEFAYRLAQAGAVFIPDEEAQAVHLGLPGQRREHRESIIRLVETHLAQKVPIRRELRKERGRQWVVPYVEIVLDVTQSVADADVPAVGEREVRAAVAAALGGTLTDVVVTLVGPWSRVPDPTPGDPWFEVALLRDCFRHDPRVRLAEEIAPTAAPTPFRFTGPLDLPLAADSLERMTREITQDRLGLLVITFPDGRTARLERTDAMARARLLCTPVEGQPAAKANAGEMDEIIEETHGVRHAQAKEFWPEKAAPRPASPAPSPSGTTEQKAGQKKEQETGRKPQDTGPRGAGTAVSPASGPPGAGKPDDGKPGQAQADAPRKDGVRGRLSLFRRRS